MPQAYRMKTNVDSTPVSTATLKNVFVSDIRRQYTYTPGGKETQYIGAGTLRTPMVTAPFTVLSKNGSEFVTFKQSSYRKDYSKGFTEDNIELGRPVRLTREMNKAILAQWNGTAPNVDWRIGFDYSNVAESVKDVSISPAGNILLVSLMLDFVTLYSIKCFVKNNTFDIQEPVNFMKGIDTAKAGAKVLAGQKVAGKKGEEVQCFTLSEIALGLIQSKLRETVEIVNTDAVSEVDVQETDEEPEIS